MSVEESYTDTHAGYNLHLRHPRARQRDSKEGTHAAPPVQVSLLAFYAAVAAAGWHGGLGSAVLATCLSAIAIDYLLLAPAASLRVEAPADIVALAVFVLSGLALGVMMNAFQRRQRRERSGRLRAEQTRRQAEHLLAVTTALSRARTPADVSDACVLEVSHSLSAAAADGSPESGEPGGQFAVEPGLCLTEAVETLIVEGAEPEQISCRTPSSSRRLADGSKSGSPRPTGR
jgi:K+-sensing histidine kinase KdpD